MAGAMGRIFLKFKDVEIKRGADSIVENLNLDLSLGEIVTLIGPNGAGKSTTAKLAIGLLHPTSGTIWKDSSIKCAYVPQSFAVDSSMPIKVKHFMNLNKRLNKDEIDFYLSETGAYPVKDSMLSKLSGGEMRRVLLARAIAQKPDFLVLDEPLQGVDYSSEKKLYKLISKVRDRTSCSVLLISHDLNIVMVSADKVICLDKTICCKGTPAYVSTTKHYTDLLGDHRHISYDHKTALHEG